jgi:beta-phosphoglucomutase
LEKVNIVGLFDVVVDGNKVTKAKPDPEVFLTGARELGVEPGHCVVFEDAIAGVEAALRGGMKAVGVGSVKVLGEADLVINGLDEMTLGKLESL